MAAEGPELDGLARQAQALRGLHRRGDPLVLPNAWDAASARAVEEAGFAAVATSSGAVAASLGYTDDDSMPPEAAFGAVARIARSVSVPVTADLEGGYRLVAGELVERLVAAGAVGCNLEDTDHHGAALLVEAPVHAARLAGVNAAGRAIGVDIVLNARVDIFRLAPQPTTATFEEAIHRAALYVEAGADCVYPIRLADERLIADFVGAVDAPVNILARPGAPPLRRLAELGVARVSFAGALFRSAHAALSHTLDVIAAEGGP